MRPYIAMPCRRRRCGLMLRMLKDCLWLDREPELTALREALASGRSLLITGPAGAGKTALVDRALASLKPVAARRFLRVNGPKGLHDLLEKLVAELHAARDKTLAAQLPSEGVRADGFAKWLRAQSSSRLKGALYRAADASDCAVVLDHAAVLTAPEAKVLTELAGMRRTPVYFITRNHDASAAALLPKIFWDPATRLELGALPERAAAKLLEQAIRQQGLGSFELQDFRAEVLRRSGRLPGAMLTLCALAAEPRYHYGKRIKTKLVYIDFKLAAASSRLTLPRPDSLGNRLGSNGIG
jgi:AAA ATPase domain